jgi:hypothetical protein
MGVKFNPFTGNLDLIDTTAAAGADTQVQYNNGGSLAGSADLTWDDSGKELGVGGDINLDDGGTYETTVQVITPTANRTISFPDATGTVALVAGSSGQVTYNNAGAQAGLASANIGSTGEINISLAGAASTPPVSFTGSWFTGGTATTTKPQLLIEPTGTTSTAWSTSGTGLGVNAASGFSGRLLDLQTNGTSRMVVQGDGKLLVGTSTSANTGESQYGKLQIKGNSSGSAGVGIVTILRDEAAATITDGEHIGRIVFGDSTGNQFAWVTATADGTAGTGDFPGRLVFSTTADGASSPTERMRVASNGSVATFCSNATDGIWASSAATAGTARSLFIGSYGGSNVYSGTISYRVYTNGDVVNANNSYGPISSDERLKQDIVDAGTQWDDIKAVRLTKFRYKNDPTGELQLGPIAQELEQVSPGLITRRPASEDEIADPSNDLVDGDEVLSFKASILYMKAVKALQEAMERIETLEAKVAALEGN